MASLVGTASGDVPISPRLARELAHSEHATWRRILCDPETGVATDVSPRYQPPPRMAEFCRVRDGGTSRFPTSGARVVDLDPVVEYDHQQPGDANGLLTYRTRTGHRYPSLPHRYLDPSGPDPSGPDPPRW